MKNYLIKSFIILTTFIIFFSGCSKNIESGNVAKNEYNWEAYQFTSGEFSFELPENWREFTEIGTSQNMFFADKDVDLNGNSSNVNVNVGIPEVESNIDYSNKKIQEEVLEVLEEAAYIAIPDLTNYQSKVVENPTIFILDYDRMAEDGTVVHQTCYYLTDEKYKSAIIYATDFKDGMSPDVNEAAMRIIQTWEFDSKAMVN